MYQDLYQTDVTIVNVIIDYPFVNKFLKQNIKPCYHINVE
jgi:hypothetical protein